MSLIDRNATIDVQIQAHALLGHVFVKLNTASNAVTEYNKVRGAWKDPAAVVKKIEDAGGDDRTLRQGAHRGRRGALLLRRAAAQGGR